MKARRMIEIREIFMGEELVYHVQVIDPCPAPSQEDPYAKDGRAASVGTPARPVGASAETRRPSKAEFIRSFERERGGYLPAFVVETIIRVHETHREMLARFDRFDLRVPRRLRQAFRRWDHATLCGVYDTGTLARIRWHFTAHVARYGEHKAGLDAYARALFARQGQPHPLTIAAVVR
jgi:hypothetical protein